ncbi:hypothetical protein A3K71_02565 [archaeon RBG_16_50_20]|nr:MAG: hypothetical protein A3K71_02565 [archaeon RBG_16_50_20]
MLQRNAERNMLTQEKELVHDVQFKTIFRVYLCLLKLREASTKDVQRAMVFPTPAQAKYHLKRLGEIGLVELLDNGDFRVVSRKFGILRFFFKARNMMIPMSLFYTTFFALVTILLYLRGPSLELILLGALVTAKEAADTYSYFAML